jgi:hypothetical protein
VNKRLRQELKTAFDAPEPSRKNEFLMNVSSSKTSSFNFYLSQILYIRKRFWCLSVLLTATMIFLIQVYGTSFNSITIISSFLPFLVVIGIKEISRSTSYNMAEMEMSCKYNLSKITLIRLTLIGSCHFIIIFSLIAIFGTSSEYSLVQLLLYSITPLLICAYLSLFISNRIQANDIYYICVGVAGAVSISIFILTKNVKLIYSQRFLLLWSFVFIIMLILLGKEIKNLIKRSEELQWNLPLIN